MLNERFYRMIKENKDFRGDVPLYVARGNSQFDAEIAKKRRSRTRTGYSPSSTLVHVVVRPMNENPTNPRTLRTPSPLSRSLLL